MGCKGSKQGVAAVPQPIKKGTELGVPLAQESEEDLKVLQEVAKKIVAGLVSNAAVLAWPPCPEDQQPAGTTPVVKDPAVVEATTGSQAVVADGRPEAAGTDLKRADEEAAVLEKVSEALKEAEEQTAVTSSRPGFSLFACCSYDKSMQPASSHNLEVPPPPSAVA